MSYGPSVALASRFPQCPTRAFMHMGSLASRAFREGQGALVTRGVSRCLDRGSFAVRERKEDRPVGESAYIGGRLTFSQRRKLWACLRVRKCDRLHRRAIRWAATSPVEFLSLSASPSRCRSGRLFHSSNCCRSLSTAGGFWSTGFS